MPYMQQVIPLLLDGLSGRTWAGKEALIETLTTASVSCRKYFENNENRAQLDIIANVLKFNISYLFDYHSSYV
jgi:proteasome component ECM29